jgi:prepilin signal peptidase PulO-like enzyme (type II secretory pathway)
MNDPRSQRTIDGVYAFSSKVPNYQVELAMTAYDWAKKAAIWLICAAFLGTFLPFCIYIAISEGDADTTAVLTILSVLAAICMVQVALKMFLLAIALRTSLILSGAVVFLPAGNIATALYEAQASRLQYVPDGMRRTSLRDMLIEKSLVMLRANFLIGQLVEVGYGPGDGKYDAVSREMMNLERDIVETFDGYVEGEPL